MIKGFTFLFVCFLASCPELAKLLLTIPFVDVAVTNLEFSGKNFLHLVGTYCFIIHFLVVRSVFFNGQPHAFTEFTGLHSRLLSQVLGTLLTLSSDPYFAIQYHPSPERNSFFWPGHFFGNMRKLRNYVAFLQDESVTTSSFFLFLSYTKGMHKIFLNLKNFLIFYSIFVTGRYHCF